jgi:hypothetical protein
VGKRPPAVSEAAWRAILYAAAPMKPDAQARAALDECIHAYSLLPVDPEKLHADRDQWNKVATLARDLAHELFQIKRRTPWTVHDPERPQRQLRAVIEVQRYAERQVEGRDVLLQARQGRRDPEREWLFQNLFEIWVAHFAGRLTVSRRGPLVRFISAVFEHLLGESISPETIRDAARRAKVGGVYDPKK